jgi:mycothiol synthase
VSETKPVPQLEMVWPERLIGVPPIIWLPPGYLLRTYQPGDEVRFRRVMELSGWPGWDQEKLKPLLARILPEGWLMAVDVASGEIVATAMAVHSSTERHPFGGELSWVASDPVHRGKGLGRAVCAAVTARLLAAGYRNIHLYTDDFRHPALLTYLRLGYVPFLFQPEMADRWQAICTTLNWPYTPEAWRTL